MPSRARVLHIGKFAYHRDGGIERHVMTLLPGLVERGFSVTAVVYSDDTESRCRVIDGVQVCSLPLTAQFASQPIASGLFSTLRRLHHEQPFDVVHVHLPDVLAHASILGLVGWQSSPRRVASWHSDIVRQRQAGALYSRLSPIVLPRWHALIGATVSHLRSTQIPSYVDTSHRYVIPYGIDTSRFGTTGEIERAAQKIRLELNGTPLVLVVGRLVPYKGIQVLLSAMVNVPASLIVIGDGPLRAELEDLTKTLGISDRVRFLGHRSEDELKAYYRACDIFCLPSVSQAEAFGLVQAEAMLFERPVVNTLLHTGVNEVSKNGVSGLTVPPNDAGELANALRSLIESPELRGKMGRAGRVRVLESFSCEAMWDGTADVYRQLLRMPRVDNRE